MRGGSSGPKSSMEFGKGAQVLDRRVMYEVTLADVCLGKPNALESAIQQMPHHTPKGKVIVPLTLSLK